MKKKQTPRKQMILRAMYARSLFSVGEIETLSGAKHVWRRLAILVRDGDVEQVGSRKNLNNRNEKVYRIRDRVKFYGKYLLRKDKRKYCSRCGQWKKRDQFNANRAMPDGLSRWCKRCRSEYDATRTEKRQAYYRDWYSDPERRARVRKQASERYQKNKKTPSE
ncbi:hypothetical protein DENIS_3489 [Desulfonema ishimotonii]|uniref:Uncharacterized protein n=1 Tax=Desulfonema ishimotonii TaxID=45657 RepID=A0A401FZZ4_9BACT|nr:hypothetical protein [Desulfonema ishimotonii]GBC62517.1 hypothetical protein DENIS_3489 [Desulfonema ishimotonii]